MRILEQKFWVTLAQLSAADKTDQHQQVFLSRRRKIWGSQSVERKNGIITGSLAINRHQCSPHHWNWCLHFHYIFIFWHVPIILINYWYCIRNVAGSLVYAAHTDWKPSVWNCSTPQVQAHQLQYVKNPDMTLRFQRWGWAKPAWRPCTRAPTVPRASLEGVSSVVSAPPHPT